jgi:hypothetical protein
MLETSELLIALPPGGAGDRKPASVSSPRRRVIADARTRTVLGFADYPGTVRRGWWPWTNAPTLTVHELLDEPLLFTLQRCWLLWYTVFDADDHTIGYVGRGKLRNTFGRALAERQVQTANTWLYQGLRGQPLAQLVKERDGGRLTFAPAIQEEPFLKMILLADVLVR